MKRTDPMSIRQIIDKVLDSSSRKNEYMEQRAMSYWPEVVGPGVNRLTQRRYVSRGILHVVRAAKDRAGVSEICYNRHS